MLTKLLTVSSSLSCQLEFVDLLSWWLWSVLYTSPGEDHARTVRPKLTFEDRHFGRSQNHPHSIEYDYTLGKMNLGSSNSTS